MKKVLCLALVFVMALSALPVLAEGNIVSRSELFDELELFAEREGISVYRKGASFALQNGSDYLVISNDEATYMEKGMIKKENIYVDGCNVKYPEAAIKVFLGIDLEGKL